jgi:hypothetical protein
MAARGSRSHEDMDARDKAAMTVVIVRLDRTTQYSRDGCDGAERPRRTGCPAFAEHDGGGRHGSAISRHEMSELFKRTTLEDHRGCRECRMRDAPVAACATKKHRRQQLQVRRINRHSLRNGFNGFLRALPGDRALLPPSCADRSAHLAPASGRQNHTTSPSAAASFVRAIIAPDAAASIASRSQRP